MPTARRYCAACALSPAVSSSASASARQGMAFNASCNVFRLQPASTKMLRPTCWFYLPGLTITSLHRPGVAALIRSVSCTANR